TPVPIQGTARFEAHALGADDQPVPEAPLRWSVGDTTLAIFDPATGVLTGRKAGKTQLVVKGPGLGLAYTWSIRVIAAGLKLSAAERANLAQLRKVLDDSSTASEPAYSPDGSRLAFVSTRDGQPEIYVMDADGTSPSRLTNAPGADGAPSFTADGRAVVFHSPRAGHRQIFVQPITSSDAIQLTQEPSDNSQPSASPDGETIAFVSSRDGSDDIWLMSRDGSNQRNFPKSPH